MRVTFQTPRGALIRAGYLVRNITNDVVGEVVDVDHSPEDHFDVTVELDLKFITSLVLADAILDPDEPRQISIRVTPPVEEVEISFVLP